MQLTKVDRLPWVCTGYFVACTGQMGSKENPPVPIEPRIEIELPVTEAEYYSGSIDSADYRVALPTLPAGSTCWMCYACGADKLSVDTPSGRLEEPLTYADLGDRIILLDENGALHQLKTAGTFDADDGEGRTKVQVQRASGYSAEETRGLSITPDPPGIRIVEGELTRR